MMSSNRSAGIETFRREKNRMTGPRTGRPKGGVPKIREAKRATGELKTLEPLPAQAITVSGQTPDPPEYLHDDGIKLWYETWEATKLWSAPETDYHLISMLCRAWDEHESIRRQLDSGEIARWYTTANGQVASHAAVKQLAELRVQMTAWMSSLGMSPADRTRLGLAEVRVRNELDELEQRRARRAASK
jgi:P27 family predicted phage terminase small subunit